MQQPQAGLPAIAATSTAAERDSPVTTPAAPTASVPATAAAAPAAEAAVDSNQLQDPAVLSDLLRTLEQLEAQEQEICNRWFGSGEVPAVPVGRQSTQVTRRLGWSGTDLVPAGLLLCVPAFRSTCSPKILVSLPCHRSWHGSCACKPDTVLE